jgi:hypothetical protein
LSYTSDGEANTPTNLSLNDIGFTSSVCGAWIGVSFMGGSFVSGILKDGENVQNGILRRKAGGRLVLTGNK